MNETLHRSESESFEGENNYLKGLNYQQLEAVTNTEGPLLVLAGAGTGKTKALTTRIAHILASGLAAPPHILAVTFTNKAAREMNDRVNSITPASGIWLGTFHSLAARILRRHSEIFDLSSNFTIIDKDDQLRVIKNLLKEKNIDTKAHPPKYVASIISQWKDMSLIPEKVSNSDISSQTHHIARQVYPAYMEKLRNSDAVDFGDLLLYNNELFLKHSDILSHYQENFKYILVDEYQDTNAAQYLWIRMLGSLNKNICCVGDDDQSIYSWRGAEVTNILKFEKDFPEAKIIKLEQNYRSTGEVLTAASGLIKNNRTRHDKTLWTENNNGNKLQVISCFNDKEEARFITSEIESLLHNKEFDRENIAVLVRAGFQTRAFEEAFIANSLSYRIIGGLKFYERMEIRDALAYLRVTVNPKDNLALERIINVPKRSIGNATLQKIKDYAAARQISVFEAMEQMSSHGGFKGKTQTTIASLVESFRRWKNFFELHKPGEAAKKIMHESGYIDSLKQEKSEAARTRQENLREMFSAIGDFSSIEEFLEHTSLVVDNPEGVESSSVNLMTLHAAKGLEFGCVFLPGWEEGVFPHQKALSEEGEKGLEEERRIAYVGITRAREKVYISHAENRKIYNEFMSANASRFLGEIPDAVKQTKASARGLNYMGTNHNFSMNIPKSAEGRDKLTRSPTSPGAKVSHNKFGSGIIISKHGDNLEVAFEKEGVKKIKEDYVTPINT
jgi:DNA helicase-2/ATP-dependent DNA helicase PcrA